MFCNQCGKENAEATKFCSSCGATLEAGAKPNMPAGIALTVGDKPVSVYVSLGLAVLGIIFLFLKWIHIPLMNAFSMFLGDAVDNKFSLFQSTRFVNQLNELAEGEVGGLGFFSLLFTILTIANLILLGFFIFMALTNYKKSVIAGQVAFGLSAFLPVVVFIVIGIINSVIKVKSEGIVPSLLSTTAAPILMLILGVAGFLLVFKGIKGK